MHKYNYNYYTYINVLLGVIPGFPNVVGMLDCTCIRINRPPTGGLQRLYYRRDYPCEMEFLSSRTVLEHQEVLE